MADAKKVVSMADRRRSAREVLGLIAAKIDDDIEDVIVIAVARTDCVDGEQRYDHTVFNSRMDRYRYLGIMTSAMKTALEDEE